ncbi:MAG: hypothetical protein ACRELD_07570 [Longimicrobiales bacterium]
MTSRIMLWLACPIAVVSGGCDSIFGADDQRPEQARIIVEGSAPAPLQLITSTRFRRFINEDGEVRVELIVSDTASVAPPLDRTLQLSGQAVGVFARLTNPDTMVASVRMRVLIDNDVRYDQLADLSDASLEFSFVFTQAQPLQ